jgi:hypothetical protein
MEKINGNLPDFNDKTWPKENLNKLRNIRGVKIPLNALIKTKVTLFTLWKLMIKFVITMISIMIMIRFSLSRVISHPYSQGKRGKSIERPRLA